MVFIGIFDKYRLVTTDRLIVTNSIVYVADHDVTNTYDCRSNDSLVLHLN